MSEERTVWVTRDMDELLKDRLVLFHVQPVFRWSSRSGFARTERWMGLSDKSIDIFRYGSGSVIPPLYWTLGLPQEPNPGECWRVDWVEGATCHGDELPDLRIGGLIPIATDVTEELKGKR